jgi:alkanesulfonate monooxygenase SsuD/methylene tetrahydromethanopterin reductase-like flavin-dependent oxidoreductase (luciferase family)
MSTRCWFEDALELAELGDRLGFAHVRTVEHYFRRYGGWSPNPIVMLAAASQRTSAARLITGAVLPVFNHLLKLAGEIGMLDAISGGRLEVGFARAFLPHEFRRFGVDLSESRARFEEGLESVRILLKSEDVSFEGRFHRFPPTTSLPRPTQRPRPPFWIAAMSSEESFARAGELGHGVMAIPLAPTDMGRLVAVYREAWRDAGHAGDGRVMLAVHMLCHPDPGVAIELARGPLKRYLAALVEAARDWTATASSDYPGFGKMIAALERDDVESQVAKGGAWIDTPDEIADQLERYVSEVGEFEVASMQVGFSDVPRAVARRSLELFASEVAPRFAGTVTLPHP